MRIRARAKINLFLQILGKRPDGYHDLRTLMQEINLSDELIFKKAVGEIIKISCSDRNLPVNQGNLVYRAAEILKKEAWGKGLKTSGLQIHIRKNIPVGAGLGGGSSDAAATLKALNVLWELRFTAKKLAEIGSRIGSDVPFFIYGGTALASGRGEKLNKWPDLPSFRLVLIKPFFSISTAWAYKNLKINLTKRPKNIKIIQYCLRKGWFGKLREHIFNDLEQVAVAKHPQLKEIQQELLNLGAVAALMSGSGSTVFGIVPNKKVEVRIKEVFGQRVGFWVWSGSTFKFKDGEQHGNYKRKSKLSRG